MFVQKNVNIKINIINNKHDGNDDHKHQSNLNHSIGNEYNYQLQKQNSVMNYDQMTENSKNIEKMTFAYITTTQHHNSKIKDFEDTNNKNNNNEENVTLVDHDNDNYYECDYDYDNPRYCPKCNIWFGVSDASYPFKCNCLVVISSNIGAGGDRTDTLNTIDTQSVYSINSMDKDFRLV